MVSNTSGGFLSVLVQTEHTLPLCHPVTSQRTILTAKGGIPLSCKEWLIIITVLLTFTLDDLEESMTQEFSEIPLSTTRE